KVLVSGGHSGSSRLASAEVYDPASGTWSTTASMASARHMHEATLLPNGKVLVSGTGDAPTSSAEVYDPASGTWSVAASMTTARYSNMAATSLPSGQVLVTGGWNGSSLTSAELYTP
ncbi:MAG TPA: kelch repeat-containing protein, partial [Archangium sp.]